MGTATTVAQFVKNIDDLGGRIAYPNKKAAREAGKLFGEMVDKAADRKGATSWAQAKRPRYVERTLRNGDVIIRPGNLGANVALNSGTDRHIIGARRRGTRKSFQKNAAVIGATIAFGGSNSFGTRGGRGKLALSWAGATHPTPYAFVEGTSGFHFIGPGTKAGLPKAAEHWLRVKRTELIRGGR